MASRRHKRGHDHEEEHENEERWLVSFADMMTLLFCLFMVLFAISSVNTSKFQELSKALQNAFSGAILSGGKAPLESGSQEQDKQPTAEPPLPALAPLSAMTASQASGRPNAAAASAAEQEAQREQESFEALKRRIDALARREHVARHVHTEIRRDGLIIELLTDNVFFDSGSATLKSAATSLLDKVGRIVAGEQKHPVVVEGHTDSQPIGTAQYPSNWQLSGARAAAVVQNLAGDGVLERRLSLAGYASERPAATNSTPQGRARNRRVDIVLTRLHGSASTAGRRP